MELHLRHEGGKKKEGKRVGWDVSGGGEEDKLQDLKRGGVKARLEGRHNVRNSERRMRKRKSKEASHILREP